MSSSNFSTQRIDRRTVDTTLGNHERRIARLERSPSLTCHTALDWGPSTLTTNLSLDFCPPSCCDFSLAQPTADVVGTVWTPCNTDIFDPTQAQFGQMYAGQLSVTIADPGFLTIDADCLEEGDPDFPNHVFSYYYSVTPPWFVRIGEGPIFVPSFGFGTARQASTGMTVPAYLNSEVWGVLIPGIDQTLQVEHLILSPPSCFARPATSYSPAYPWDWANGDTLFEGTFVSWYGGIF